MKTISAIKSENWVVPVRLAIEITDEQWDKAAKESGLTDEDDVAFYVIEKYESDEFDVSKADYYTELDYAWTGSVPVDNTGYDCLEVEAA